MVGWLLQHHPHAAAAKDNYEGWLPLHLALGAHPDTNWEIKASCEAIGMILAAHPQVRTAHRLATRGVGGRSSREGAEGGNRSDYATCNC